MGAESIETLLDNSNLEYEKKLAKDLGNLDIWIEYLNGVSRFDKRAFLYERIIAQFTTNRQRKEIQGLWVDYIHMVMKQLDCLNYYDHRVQFQYINNLFQRYLDSYPANDDTFDENDDATQGNSNILQVWGQYLSFLNRQGNIRFVLKQYQYAFSAIELLKQCIIWPHFLQLADKIAKYDTNLASDILLRFIDYGDYDISHLVKLLQWGYETGIDRVKHLLTVKQFDNNEWKLILQHLKDEKVIKTFLKLFPQDYSFGYIKLIQSVSENPSLQKHYYIEALNNADTVNDFTSIYESYVNFLESKLDEPDPSEHDINDYEQLLNNREIMINDIYLRNNRDNLDFWFKRFAIYENDNDMNNLLKTFVKAIASINPIKCFSSENHTLSEIWRKYANVYSSKGDLKTANLIYTKAVRSKFKTLDNLVDIYIEWSNLFVTNNKPEEGIELLEKVLFNKNEISRSITLWLHYFEILEIYVDDMDKIISSYYKMIELKYATPLIIFNFANFLQDENKWDESFAVYEVGLREFNDSQIKFEIYNNYIIKMIKYIETNEEKSSDKRGKERVRDLFDKCLRELPEKPLVRPIIILYAEFEFNNGLMLRGFKILNEYIMSTSEDPIDLIFLIINKFNHTQHEADLRNWLTEWSKLQTLSNKSFIQLMKFYIAFETQHRQITRVRHLFKHLHSNVPSSFSDWETFELEHGDEPSFRAMLRFKKTLDQSLLEPKPSGDERGIDFIKESKPKAEHAPQNPDEIDIDM